MATTRVITFGLAPDVQCALDDRAVFDTIADRNALRAGRAYNGLVAYVLSDDTLYALIDATNPSVDASWVAVARQGEQGPAGPPGMNGVNGADGPGYNNLAVDSDGNITADAVNGATPFVTANIRGPQGIMGEPGTNGAPGAPGRDGVNGMPGRDGETPQLGAAVGQNAGITTIQLTSTVDGITTNIGPLIEIRDGQDANDTDARIPMTVTIGNYPRFSRTDGTLEQRTPEQVRNDISAANVVHTHTHGQITDFDAGVEANFDVISNTAKRGVVGSTAAVSNGNAVIPLSDNSNFTITGIGQGGGGGGGGATNLDSIENADNVLITSSTGTSATIPGATTTAAGVLTSTDKTKLDALMQNDLTISSDADLPANVLAELNLNDGTTTINTNLIPELRVGRIHNFDDENFTTGPDALAEFVRRWNAASAGDAGFFDFNPLDAVFLKYRGGDDVQLYVGMALTVGGGENLSVADFRDLVSGNTLTASQADDRYIRLDASNASNTTISNAAANTIRTALRLNAEGSARLTIAANTSGTAAFASQLSPGRNINGVLFNGTQDITIPDTHATISDGTNTVVNPTTITYSVGAQGEGLLVGGTDNGPATVRLPFDETSDLSALTNEVKHNTSHINTIDEELQVITNPTGTYSFGTALGGDWSTLEAYYEDATRTVTVTTTDPDGLPDAWENLSRGTILYGFNSGVTPAGDGSDNSSFRVEVTSVAFQQVRLRAADDASNTFLTSAGTLSFGIRDYTDSQEETFFGGLRTATVTAVNNALVQSGTDGSLTRVAIGNNLTLSNGTLSATGNLTPGESGNFTASNVTFGNTLGSITAVTDDFQLSHITFASTDDFNQFSNRIGDIVHLSDLPSPLSSDDYIKVRLTNMGAGTQIGAEVVEVTQGVIDSSRTTATTGLTASLGSQSRQAGIGLTFNNEGTSLDTTFNLDTLGLVTPSFPGYRAALGGDWSTLYSIYQNSNRQLTITRAQDGDVGGGSLPQNFTELVADQTLFGFAELDSSNQVVNVTPAAAGGSANNTLQFTVTSVSDTQLVLTAANDATHNFLENSNVSTTDRFGTLHEFSDAIETTVFGGLRLLAETGSGQNAIVISTADGTSERAVIGDNFKITTANGQSLIDTNNPEITVQARTGLNGGGAFTGNQLHNEVIPLDVNVNDPALSNIPGILENAAEIARLTNNGLSTHRHVATPPYFVPHPNQQPNSGTTVGTGETAVTPAAPGDQIAFTGAGTNSAFGDLTFRATTVASNNTETTRNVLGGAIGDTGLIRVANYWQPSQALDRSPGLRRFANEYRRAYLLYQGAQRHIVDRQVILQGNRTGPEEQDTGGLYDRLELLTSWQQVRETATHPIWNESAQLSAAAGAITLYNGNTPLTQGFADYTGWQVGLSYLDVGALTIFSQDVSPWDSRMRLAYQEGIVCFQTSDNSNAGTVGSQTVAENACIPVRRVVEYNPVDLRNQTTASPGTAYEIAGRLVATTRARYWEFPNNNFTSAVTMPFDQPFQVYWLAPATVTSFATGGNLSDATQLTRREVSPGTPNARWTGVPYSAFGDPNSRFWISTAGPGNIARRDEVAEARLYVNGSTVDDATLAEIVGMPESSSGAGDGTGWRGLPAFDGAGTMGAQYAQIGLSYQHDTPTQNPNVIITKNPDTSNPAGDNQLTIRNGNLNTTFERLVIGAQNTGINYLRILFQAGGGDNEIALNTPFGITEIYDEFYSEGRNLGYDLHTLAHNRPINVFPLPIDNSWIADTITRDSEFAINGNTLTTPAGDFTPGTGGAADSINVDRTPDGGPLPVLVAEQITGASTTVATEVGLTVNTTGNAVNIGIGTGAGANGSLRIRGLSGTGTRNVGADENGNLIIDSIDDPAVDQTEYDGIRNSILLTGGFVILAEMDPVTGQEADRDRYNGSIAGFPARDYWFDNTDGAWFDAATGGNELIRF